MADTRALSKYKQLRLTATETAGGKFDYRISVKPLRDPWSMRHTVFVDTIRLEPGTDSLEDVLRVLVAMLSSHLPDE